MLPSSEMKPTIIRKLLHGLVDAHALLLHLLRQQRRGQLQLVLHLHLGDVRVGAGVEGQRDGHVPSESLAESM